MAEPHAPRSAPVVTTYPWRTLTLMALAATVAQAVAWQLVMPDSSWVLGILLSGGYWIVALTLMWPAGKLMASGPQLQGWSVCGPATVGTLASAPLLGIACLSAIPPVAAVTWAGIVGLESAVLAAGCVLVVTTRRTQRARSDEQAALLRHVQSERRAIATAMASMQGIAQQALDEAQEAARNASSLILENAPRDTIEWVLESRIRANARQASHSIAAVEVTPSAGRTPTSPLWRDILLAEPHFTLSFALVGALGLPLAALLEGPVGVAMQVLASLLGWLAAQAIRAATRRWRYAGVAGLSVGCLVGTSTVVISWIGLSGSALALACALTPLCVLTALVPSAWTTEAARQERTVTALAAQVAEEQRLLRANQEQLEQCRADLITALHTTVQGRATAALVALDLGVETHRVEGILHGMGGTLSVEGTDCLGVVLDEWRSTLAITEDIDPNLDDTSRQRLARHVGEGLLNAVRHGRAQSVHLMITETHEQTVMIMDDDGLGPSEDATPGLGSKVAQREGGSWTLASGPLGGARVIVTLPRSADF